MGKYVKYAGAALGAIVLIAGLFYARHQHNSQMTYNEFKTQAADHNVAEVIYSSNENLLEVKLSGDSTTYKVPNPKSDTFMDSLLAQNIKVSYRDDMDGSAAGQLILLLGIGGGLIFYRLRSKNKGLIRNANASSSEPLQQLTLNDIAGNVEAKAMVDDIIGFMKNPEKYTGLGAQMPRGILFYGPPGTGKTLMAQAIAGEAGVPFYPMSGSDFIQTYVGVGASRIRELFGKAKKAEKAVIFIDEIDAIGKRRSNQPGGSHDERDQTLNALLTEMSGFSGREGIIVIAATNRLDTLDEALTRPGRFDRLVEINLPDINARRKILELHAATKPLAETVSLEDVAKATVSFSGAMLENLLNEAAIIAANAGDHLIEAKHIDKAFYTVIAGAEKVDTSYITQTDRRITAYHEAGHALMTKRLLPDNYISKVTIIPSANGAGGFSLSIPGDALYMTKRKMLANMKVLLAGRASEELIFGGDEITTGAGNDIEKASALAADYITRYGMDEQFGIFNSYVLEVPPTAQLLDSCREKLNQLYQETKEELACNIDSLHNIAAGLLEYETLGDEDINDLCA